MGDEKCMEKKIYQRCVKIPTKHYLERMFFNCVVLPKLEVDYPHLFKKGE